jgi:hypothetical protein
LPVLGPSSYPRARVVAGASAKRTKRQILIRPGARFSEVARRYGIAERVLFRWKQKLTPAAVPMFVTVEITDANTPCDAAHGNEEHAS